jgi:hypothetical protein
VAPERPAAPALEQTVAVLRPPREGDLEAIGDWYDKATVLAGEQRSLSDLLDSSAQVLVLTGEGSQEPVGLAVLSVDDPEPGWATVALLAIAGQQQRELAAHAVALLEADLRPHASRIRAAVPPDVGLALYFWLRLGYRPVTGDARLWTIRDLDP